MTKWRLQGDTEWKTMPTAQYEAEKRAREEQRKARLPPFPYKLDDLYDTTEYRIKAIANDLRNKGFGTYKPQDRSSIASVRGELKKKYPQFTQRQ
jgi:hypothetical protein